MLAFISSSLSFSPLAPGLVVPRSTAASSVAAISMDVSPKRNIPSATTDMDEYLKGRDTGRYQGGSNAKASEELKEWAKYDTDFDGGDSGGGVVGDGNTDLEDVHNAVSATMLRSGGQGSVATSGAGGNVGRGKVKSATESRVASAGKNYFGRSTGYADQLINDRLGPTGETDRNHRFDKVRAQQKENWMNQREIHRQNRAAGQGVVFGQQKGPAPSSGGYIAREAIASKAWRRGDVEGEISQRALADHLDEMAAAPAERLDGEAWGKLTPKGGELMGEVFAVRCAAGQTIITEIPVRNDMNTFAPYQCGFTDDSPAAFSVTPTAGTMNRRSGDPVNVIVRFSPKQYGEPMSATLVFETEDMKKVYKFTGGTA